MREQRLKCNTIFIQSQSTLPTKKLNTDMQADKQQKIEFVIQKQQETMVVKEVYDSYKIKISEHIEKVISKANKQRTSHFLIIETKQKYIEESFYIYLFDHYSNLTKIRKGMQIRVIGEFDDENTIILTCKQECLNSFILEPEWFIAPSVLNQLSYCKRKAFLKEFFQNQAFGTTIEMLGGTIVHELFQTIIKNPLPFTELFKEIEQLDQCLQNINELDIKQLPSFYFKTLTEIHSKFLQEFYLLEKMEMNILVVHILQKSTNALKWIKRYILEKQPIFIKQQRKEYEIYITKWIQNEQSIQSTYFGLKGFLDIVVEVKYRENDQQFRSMVIPIELKTGHQSQSYEQQVQIYMVLIRQSYQSDCNIGLLLYLNTLDHVVITCNSSQENMLYFTRNLYISEIFQFEKLSNCYSALPDIVDEIKSEVDINRKCRKCDAVSACYGLHIYTNQSELNFIIPEYEEMKAHIQQKTKEYLNIMLTGLRQEEQAYLIPSINYIVKKIIFDEKGITFSLQSKSFHLKQYANKIVSELNSNTFIKLFSLPTQQTQKYKLLAAKLFQGDSINIIDSQNDTEIVESEENFDYAIQIKLFLETDSIQIKKQNLNVNDEVIYKPFQKNMFKHHKHTIFELATNDIFFRRKKELIIFKMEPQFTPISELPENRRCAVEILNRKLNQFLNLEKIQAIEKILQAEDYYLIADCDPRRQLLIHLLYLLGYMNSKVIIFAQNYELLEDIAKSFINEFQCCSDWATILCQDKDQYFQLGLNFTFKNYKNFNEVNDQLENKKLYFSLYESCTDIIQSQQFDYCIIENASSIIEPLCLSCLMKSKVFVLFGSLSQSDAITQSYKPTQLSKSLFQRLIAEKDSHNYLSLFLKN